MKVTRLRGARTNNLKGIDVDLHPGTWVAIVGPSGSGKSSLAFSTLHAEGQRRFIESFSAYARQFLERLPPPPIDSLDPVPTSIAVERHTTVKTSRSTVGTMTELSDYAKNLWSALSELRCPGCSNIVRRESPSASAVDVLERVPTGTRIAVTYRESVPSVEAWLDVRERLLRDGYRRVWKDGETFEVETLKPSDVLADFAQAVPKNVTAKSKPVAKTAKKSKSKAKADAAPAEPTIRTAGVDVIVDRLTVERADGHRLAEALEAAMLRGAGRADVRVHADTVSTIQYSSGFHCARCDRSFAIPTPALFSFNSAAGACVACRGFGRTIGIDWEKVVPDHEASLEDGAIAPWEGKKWAWERRKLAEHAARAGVRMDVPFRELTQTERAWLEDGDKVGHPKGWFGIKQWFKWVEAKSYKMHVRVFLSRLRKYEECAACHGSRLRPESGWYEVNGAKISDWLHMDAATAREFVRALLGPFAGTSTQASPKSSEPTNRVIEEVDARLSTLVEVGLGYLQLDRSARTLSGGETQRVMLTGALASSLTGAMWVFDEPSAGLHPQDVERLGGVVRRLVGHENIVITVEHDPQMINAADRVIELGYGSGEAGGSIVFDGTPEELLKASTATGRVMRNETDEPKSGGSITTWKSTGGIEIRGARGNNLQVDRVSIPFRSLTCVTGVSGSGKSSLIVDTLVRHAQRRVGASDDVALDVDGITGLEGIEQVLFIDGSALSRTARGTPATYLGLWDLVRKRFVAEPLAKERGLTPGYFSFNVAGGRCDACSGEGAETVEMQFLADVSFPCVVCGGKRFSPRALEVLHRGRSVSDILQMTVSDALDFFGDDPSMFKDLDALHALGLEHLRLGQPLSTLSAGEAQRLRLASIVPTASSRTLLVLDEPTQGLHGMEILPLVRVLRQATVRGATVVVIEHDMRVAARADWIIDMGPGPGREGGRIVIAGTPEDVSLSEASTTGAFLWSEMRGRRDSYFPAPVQVRNDNDELRVVRVVDATENNLKHVSVQIPREKLIAVTGPSGSGKSSLAFGVIHAEAQRRYLDTLSVYARQYLPQLPRAHVGEVTGLPPSVALAQRVHRTGGMSTVATLTEIAHYVRLLYARVGLLHCPTCAVEIRAEPVDKIVTRLRERFGPRTKAAVLAPIVRARKGHHGPVFARATKGGVTEARIDGEWTNINSATRLSRFDEHTIELVLDRPRVGSAAFAEAIANSFAMVEGTARIVVEASGGVVDELVSCKRSCPQCGVGFPEADPRLFSFSTREGGCSTCEGRGQILAEESTIKSPVFVTCGDCSGTRLSPLARAVTVNGIGIDVFNAKSIRDAKRFTSTLTWDAREEPVAGPIVRALMQRYDFLQAVDADYLGLDRRAESLSGGEVQRVRLAAQLGAGLTGVLYVLDEPTIGLHPRDTQRLIGAFRALVDRGSTVIVVEHDLEVIRSADHVIDIGPAGGSRGGEVVADGPIADVLANPRSLTASSIAAPLSELSTSGRGFDRSAMIHLSNATLHNLANASVAIPRGKLTVVTGVSGSGKSSLVRGVLMPAVHAAVARDPKVLPFGKVSNLGRIARAVEIDQNPIGRTPRSTPATYVGIWDDVRKLYSAMTEAKARGFGPSRFSFNVEGGRCATCEGQGSTVVEMSFLPDVLVPCDACAQMRFNTETLAVRFRGHSVGDILKMTVGDALETFESVPRIHRPLALLADLGLDYLTLGQASNTLSGGEAQRLKIVSELGSREGATFAESLYVMDEPTTGLHRADVLRLIDVVRRLVAQGHTLVIIEHNLDVVAAADWMIDVGPGSGSEGGRVVFEGAPADSVDCAESETGKALALARDEHLGRAAATKARAARDADGQRVPRASRRKAQPDSIV